MRLPKLVYILALAAVGYIAFLDLQSGLSWLSLITPVSLAILLVEKI